MNVGETGDDGNLPNSEIAYVQQHIEETEAVETRRRELGQIQQDLRMLMDRLNNFIVGNTLSYNPEDVNSSNADDIIKSVRNEIEAPNVESNGLFDEILSAEIEKHLKDMREIQNLSVLTNVLMTRIRKVTHLDAADTVKDVDQVTLRGAEGEDNVTICDIEQTAEIIQ